LVVTRRTVIVSGGTYGIGREITIALAREGWAVVAFGLDARQPGSLAENGSSETRAALAKSGCTADVLEADVSSPSDVRRVVDHTLQQHGGIAAVVNNAAIRPTGTVLETEPASFRRVLAVNLEGPYLLSRAAIPHLRAAGAGTIVNLGSGAAEGRAGLAAYSASKAGLRAFTIALAQEHRGEGIRVHMVVPAPGTSSGMVAAIRAEAGEGTIDAEAEGAPSPAEVARVVSSLLSPNRGAAIDTIVDVANLPDELSRSGTSDPR
jgi:NAD(P)-dependent dehydrogenase (short-subunit alcohol dehydrogenase family)